MNLSHRSNGKLAELARAGATSREAREVASRIGRELRAAIAELRALGDEDKLGLVAALETDEAMRKYAAAIRPKAPALGRVLELGAE